MNIISNMVDGTPTWVWVLLVFLLMRGIRATRGGVVQFWRLLIIPAIFSVWGLVGLLTTLKLTALSAGTWGGAIVIGCCLGDLLSRNVAIRADKARGLVELPGSPFTLVLILMVFIAKYALAYQLAVNPSDAQSSLYIVCDAGISGLVAGLFIGRVWNYHKKYQVAEGADFEGLKTAHGQKA